MVTQPQTFTIAQARASAASGLLVVDSGADIVGALPNPALIARIASFTLSGTASLTAAQMTLLFPIAGKLHDATGALQLTGAATLSVAQLTALEALPGFSVATTGNITLSDTTAQVVGMLANHPAWFAQVSTISVQLDGTAIGAYPASQLNGLITHGKSVAFVASAGHTTLPIAAALHDLATNMLSLNALGTHQALTFTVTNVGTAISAIDAVTLSTLNGFNAQSRSLIVFDNGANLSAHVAGLLGIDCSQITVASGTLSATASQLLDPTVHFAAGAHAQLAVSAMLDAADADAVAQLPGYGAAAGATLTVADTALNLTANSSPWLAAAGAVLLTSNATLSAASASAMAALATHFGGAFSLGGHAVSVSDTLAALTALSTPTIALAGALVLSADATVTAAQYTAFQALPNVGLGGHSITIADSAANLLALPNGSLGLAATLELSADATLGAAAAAQLAAKPGYAEDSHSLTISDTAAALASLAAPVTALAAAEQVNVSATISAATAATLATLPHVTEAAGVTLTIQDSMANLLGLGAPALALAGATRLVPGSVTTTDAAHASALAALPGFSSSGATLTVSDTLADLAAAGTASWSTVATSHAVVDSAAAIVAGAASALVTTASSVALTGPATVSAAAAATLFGLASFTGARQLTVADTTADLIAHAPALIGLACPIIVTDSATVSASGAATLAQIAAASGTGFTLGSHTLTIADSATALLGLTMSQAALAGSIVLSGDAVLGTTQFMALRALPHISLSGHLLTVSDTADDLIALSGNLALVTATTLSANATVTEAHLVALAALPDFSNAGHVLTVTDTAANLLLLSAPDLALVSAVSLSADASVTAQQAQTLLADPGFSTAGHQLVVADSAANLLALPQPIQVAASILALSGNQSVSAATLTQLSGLGIKFTEAGHVLTCLDSAANLATLSPLAIALAAAETIATSASVTAANAMKLAALPNLGLATGVTLSVQDTAANLIALGQGAPAITTAEMLPSDSVITITAQQATQLAGLPHFSAVGATITIADSVANLVAAGNTVLQAIGSSIEVMDNAANLAANATTPLLQNAASVVLSNNAQITAATAAQIASIPHFSSGPYLLTVQDTASSIAMHAAAIVQVAAGAVVTDSGPVSIAVADQLAALSTAGVLSFQGGDQLIVRDSFAALTDVANSAGFALAGRVAVVDTAANLAAAAVHNWGGFAPSYTLSQGGIITASVASSLAAVGTHYANGGYSLSVSDTASAVVGAGSAITTLGITASVADTAANLDAEAGSLVALGTAIALIHVSDTAAVSASVAAGLYSLASLISGPTLGVTDTAADVDANLPALLTLGAHVAVTVTDTAADVAAHSTDLSALGINLQVALTDTTPVTAAVVAALVPVSGNFVAGTHLAVSDSGANIAAYVAALAAMLPDLGTITLSDGTAVSASIAASLAFVDSHLAAAVMLSVTDTAASVVSNLAGLTELQGDGRVASITVAGASVADITTNLGALDSLAALVTVSDSATNVDAGLATLTSYGDIQSITLTDSGTPAMSMSLATFNADASALAKIVSPFSVTIVDSASNITTDLVSGNSAILEHASQIGQISVIGGMPVILSQSQILAAGVDDGPGSALSKLSGPVGVTGVDIGHLNQVASLGNVTMGISVIDTSAHIAADLALGNGSALLANQASLTAISSSDQMNVSLTAAQALHAGVDDGAASAIAQLSGATFVVTSATIGDLAPLSTLTVQPASVAIDDTASNISADLASGNPALVAHLGEIATITVSDGQTISLTEAELLAPQVDDGVNAVLAKVTGGPLAVTNVAAADLSEVLGLTVPPVSVAIADSAAHIVSALATELSDIGNISAITVTGGAPLTLSASEAFASLVDDGSGSLIDRLAGHVFAVTGATVSQIAALLALPDVPASISVLDSSSNIVTDLLSGSSELSVNMASIGTITVTQGTLALTDAQADSIIAIPALSNIFADLAASTIVAVSGVPVADLAGLASSGWPNLTLSVLDSVVDITGDLASGSSMLTANAASIGSVTLSTGGIVNAATLTGMAGLPDFSTGGFALILQDTASAVLGLSPGSISLAQTIDIVDSATNIASTLDALQTSFAGLALHITLTGSTPALSVTATQYAEDQSTIDAITNPGVVTVTGSAGAIAGIAGALAGDTAVASVIVGDSANDVVANLATLQAVGSKLQITLSDATIAANLVAPLLTIPNLTLGIPVSDSASQIAAVVENGGSAAVAYMNTYGASISPASVASSNVVGVNVADATALASLTDFSSAYTIYIWDTAAHLLNPAYASTVTNSPAVYLKTTGGAVTLTAANTVYLFSIPNFHLPNPDGSLNALNVADTAAHIDANLAALSTYVSNSDIASITVTGSATVSDQVLSDLQGLGAIAGVGVTLTVMDTASTISANASTQLSSGSITPTGWILSANATVSEATALQLAGLANFSAGGHTLTLSLSADMTISTSDANTLGTIAGALNLNGHHLIVEGTTAQLSTLSAGALQLITPELVDTFAHVETLAQSSPLLLGTVEITDAGTSDAADAAAVLGLLRTGNGPGIAGGALSFDHLHYVYDTVANLQAFTASSAWTGAGATQSSFRLVAQDTVANLTNPGNAAFLTALGTSTLIGNTTISAAAAESLSMATMIGFNPGSSTITVQDSAANLLNAANAGGLAMANAVTLSGPSQVDAANAESLLSIANFTLGTQLTISDNSTDLLDGVLGTMITGSGLGAHIAIQLAGPETLDAETAESLVSLPGFADANNLSIADDPSYLLASANLSAEQIATSVTVAGDETVSANTVLRLSEVPHFTPGMSHLVLAGNDFADAPTLKAVADMGSAFEHNGHSLTMTADALDLTPTEYNALQSDDIVQNGHALGVVPTGISIAEGGNTMTVEGTGVSGGTVKIYGADGSLISSNVQGAAGFTVSASDDGSGHNFSLTDVVNGSSNEGAPLVILDAALLEAAVSAVGGSFANSGSIQVDSGKFVNLYTAGSVPSLTHAALVYDPSAHTVSLDLPGHPAMTLVTLGGTTHPTSLDVSEVLFKTHG